ncbi:zinc finger protein 431-like [Rattus rattus]|uniref:zinc finger protein 431-like n=1 Tax=Rattus rattus TaxID=10117 RepID=UPI0013F2D37E|nr:zinc finger protein 431-like [Rattus rattus]
MDLDVLTYDEVHVNFTQKVWAWVDPAQKSLYQCLMLETCRNLSAVGYIWEDHTTEKYCKSSGRHGSHVNTAIVKETAYLSLLQNN